MHSKNMDSIICLFVCLFVCLTGLSVQRHAWVLLGPDLNKMLKPGYKSLYKHADWMSMKLKRKKQIWNQEIQEKKTTATPNKSSWTILLLAFWTRERRFFIQSQLPWRLYVLHNSCTNYSYNYVPSHIFSTESKYHEIDIWYMSTVPKKIKCPNHVA